MYIVLISRCLGHHKHSISSFMNEWVAFKWARRLACLQYPRDSRWLFLKELRLLEILIDAPTSLVLENWGAQCYPGNSHLTHGLLTFSLWTAMRLGQKMWRGESIFIQGWLTDQSSQAEAVNSLCSVLVLNYISCWFHRSWLRSILEETYNLMSERILGRFWQRVLQDVVLGSLQFPHKNRAAR